MVNLVSSLGKKTTKTVRNNIAIEGRKKSRAVVTIGELGEK